MTENNIPPCTFPSQQGMSSNDIVTDCLEKIRVLALAMPESDFFTAYANQQMLHQYVILIDDLAEIASYHNKIKEDEKVIN